MLPHGHVPLESCTQLLLVLLQAITDEQQSPRLLYRPYESGPAKQRQARDERCLVPSCTAIELELPSMYCSLHRQGRKQGRRVAWGRMGQHSTWEE